MPFSAAGALILIVAVILVAQTALTRHQRALGAIDDIASSSLLAAAEAVQADLRSAAKYSVYRAVWDVGKKASEYDDAARNGIADQLAAEYFANLAVGISLSYPRYDARVTIDLGGGSWPPMEISEAAGGYVSAVAYLPEGSKMSLNTWDGRTAIDSPLEDIVVAVDSRYFLLEQCMDNFVSGLQDVTRDWKYLELGLAIPGALSGKVTLNTARSEALFTSAWAAHELNTFGSSDYLASASALFGPIGLGDLEKTLDRERAYELLPPAPLRPRPGLSVYRELDVKSISYRRLDVLGRLGLSAATPVPIGSSATVWWASWEMKAELEERPVEEIFDFDNPTLPLWHSGFYAHKPLAYRWEIEEKEFKTTVTVLSLKPFTILIV